MQIDEFTENVLKEIRVKADGRFQVKKHSVTKNNNVKLTGIAVMKNEEDIGPCVYLDKFYREYESAGMRFGEIVDEVYRLILKHEEDDALDFDISGFKRWENLINAEQNKKLFEEISHRAFMDLAVVYYAVVRDSAREDIGTILILDMVKAWNKENGHEKSEYIFVGKDGQRIHSKALDTRIRKYCRYIGISEKSMHKIRKTYISTLIDSRTVNLNTIRDLVGHEDERTTLKCYCFNRQTDSQTQENIERALSI